ncbi:MAG TPA: class I tRNA ligase family protein, partial [Candidatus Thermoplasmatota archaeon]|nr:class I tRNA ligase family protein [Candidatus Thermoplasmatota archaeon]
AEADRLHLHKATRAIEAFVLDDLSNWWVRRSRDRFWGERDGKDKQSAHAALWTALHAVARLVAPFAPFMVEAMWPHLRAAPDPSSVHLAAYPTAGERDESLEAEMAQVRALAEAGRALRSKVNIPTRHPLGRAVVVNARLPRFFAILQDEINVKALEHAPGTGGLKAHVAKPNRATLGKAFKRLAGPIADAIEGLDGDHVAAEFAAGRTVGVNVEGQEHVLAPEHVILEEVDRPGWGTTKVGDTVLALRVLRDAALLAEALAREVIRRIQEVRKELDLPIDEEVDVVLAAGPEQQAQLSGFLHEVKSQVRARSVAFGEAGRAARAWDIDGVTVAAEVKPTRTVRPAAVEAA